MKPFQHTNQLINESSPYLLQHAHNPVNWYAWGVAALEKAKDEDKLVLISIGYAACHWCHVMEHESFEDDAVAKIMNDHFVCIKVDREERPDIDQVYMEAVQIMTGSGGWPLNCFALPDGRPVYGGTYFPKEQWKNLLGNLAVMYEQERYKFLEAAEDLTTRMSFADSVEVNNDNLPFKHSDLAEIIANWKPMFDNIDGGSNRAPKFPMPNSYEFLLGYANNTSDTEVLNHVTKTLDKMAQGGIYDQAGGGFARYSVDKYWKVPHFEKMLYDNSQLVSLYCKAYHITKKEEYKRVVYQTLEFIERELTSPEGAFYSSLDADSEGEEGKFYVWDKPELDQLLGADSVFYSEFYQVTAKGNWESQKNILHCKENNAEILEKYKLTETDLYNKIDTLNKIVLKAREKRIRPGLDDKILTAWNALMLKGYCEAYRSFNDEKFLQKALQNAGFIVGKMKDSDNKLFRNYKNGKASINGFLDDYAFTIDAFIALYQISFDEKWIFLANDLCKYSINHFFDKQSKFFFYTSDLDDKLIVRKKEIHDNVIPASNSAMANYLFILGKYFYNDEYAEIATQMLSAIKDNIKQGGAYYSNWANLLLKHVYQPFEIAIVGEKAMESRIELEKNPLQPYFIAGSFKNSELPMIKDKLINGKTTIYVCRDRVCRMPVDGVEGALGEIGTWNLELRN